MYFNVPVHDVVCVKCSHSFAYLAKYLTNNILGHVAAFDAFEQSASIGVFQYHVRDVLFFLVVVVQQLNDAGVIQAAVQYDLVLCIFVVNLRLGKKATNLIATSSFVSIFRASLTCP